ncbi:MAG: endonuclease/exonuclease/phosphatase family protein [Paludisphaera borealis]|uniref:endonuclease/exonuclease/phosphatase family protein n=1 Tax=Paludisphaera borealis TaxID=1387353 RepID=UPI00284AD0FE|nr:endonuclease/exonuclease/phosphatase family protein [Paludisphaera borealis]MDR3618027.1 endonuclease/exonuclease/phosphatase family protein [Paludisphaera borealis]
MRCFRFLLVASILAAATAVLEVPIRGDEAAGPIRVLAWNIWNGGDEAKNEPSPARKIEKQKRVAEAIRASGADVVAMVETYGSGEAIARELGFHFHPRGTNVSILSRWPIKEDLSVYKPFHCVGALVEAPDGRRLAVYSVWIHYVDDVWTDPHSRDGRTPADLIAKDGPSRVTEVRAILDGVAAKTAALANATVIVAGDFNSNSHLDYTEAARDQFGLVVDWPVTRTVAEAGFRDAYRVCNPKIDRKKDRTWSPRFPEQIQDRIDFVFWKGDALAPRSATMIDQAPGRWPSDHAAVLVEFAAP